MQFGWSEMSSRDDVQPIGSEVASAIVEFPSGIPNRFLAECLSGHVAA